MGSGCVLLSAAQHLALRRVALGFLVVLGLLGMHGTPAMAMSAVATSAATGAAVTGAALSGPAGSGPAMAMAMAAHDGSMTMSPDNPLVSAVPPAGTAVDLPRPGRGAPHDSDHHLMTPCLSTPAPGGVPSPAPALPSQALLPRSAGRATPLLASERWRPAAPPDLHRLCISRT